MPSVYTTYIISISGVGIFSRADDTSNAMRELRKLLPTLRELNDSQWYLSSGWNEQTYRATRTISSPVAKEDLTRLKRVFAEESKTVEIYRLEKIEGTESAPEAPGKS